MRTADTALTPSGERDLTPWLEYFVKGLLIEARRAESRIRTYLGQLVTPQFPRLTSTQHAILHQAAQRRQVTSRELADELGLSQRGIAKAAGQLVAGGLLAREGTTRAAVYFITEGGLAALAGR